MQSKEYERGINMENKRGRPFKQENQVKVMIVLPKEMIQKIDIFSNQFGVPRSTFIKMALAEKMMMLEKGIHFSNEK